MSSDVFEALRILSDIDNDYLHACNDHLHPRHKNALRCYAALTEKVSIELSRYGSPDYPTNVPPPPLIERRPGFKPP